MDQQPHSGIGNPHQQQSYEYNMDQLQRKTDGYNWQDIDSIADEQIFAKGIIDFIPAPKDLVQYKRLRYALVNEVWNQERMFILTGYMLAINTNNYYALMVRKKYFFHQYGLNSSQTKSVQPIDHILSKQMYLINCFLNDNPKEYQLWNYKKQLISACIGLSISHQATLNKQFQFIEFLLVNDDPRNYHVWDYQVFFLKKEGQAFMVRQLQKTRIMLFYDQLGQSFTNRWVSIYSLWSYRLNLLKMLKNKQGLLKEGQSYMSQEEFKNIVKTQMEIVFQFALKHCQNQCIWNYMLGIVTQLCEQEGVSVVGKIQQQCRSGQIIKKSNRFAYNFLLIWYEDRENDEKKNQIIEHLSSIDPTRSLYYKYLQKQSSK